MAVVSFVLTLAVSSLLIGMTSSAPLQVGKQDRDAEAEAEADKKLMNALKHLLEKKAMVMGLNQLSSDQAWKYPPRVDSQRREELSPSEKAARRHFELSEPGTGPILNHPLSIDAGRMFDKKTVEALVNQLLS